MDAVDVMIVDSTRDTAKAATDASTTMPGMPHEACHMRGFRNDEDDWADRKMVVDGGPTGIIVFRPTLSPPTLQTHRMSRSCTGDIRRLAHTPSPHTASVAFSDSCRCGLSTCSRHAVRHVSKSRAAQRHTPVESGFLLLASRRQRNCPQVRKPTPRCAVSQALAVALENLQSTFEQLISLGFHVVEKVVDSSHPLECVLTSCDASGVVLTLQIDYRRR